VAAAARELASRQRVREVRISGNAAWQEKQTVKRSAWVLVLFAIAIPIAACGRSSAPTAPSTLQPLTPATTFGSFGIAIETEPSASGGAFARCLQESDGTRCFSASRLGTKSVTGAAAVGTPINLSASAIGSSVTLTWIAPTSGDAVISYIIEAGSTPGTANLANFSTGSTATSFFASGVGAGTYFVRVRALGTSGISAPSNEAVLVVTGTGCTGVPGPPSGLGIALNSGGTVVLTWNGAAGNPTSYAVEAGSGPGLSNVANSDLGLTTTLTATGVGPGIYYVRIRARSACGIGPASNEIVVVVASSLSPFAGTWTGQYRIVECTDIDPPPGVVPYAFCGSLQRLNSYEFVLSQNGSAVAGTYRPVSFLMSCPCGGDYGIFDMAGTIASDGVLALFTTPVIRGWGVVAAETFSLKVPTPGALTGTVTGTLSFGGFLRGTFTGTIVSGIRQ
jgi:hypothetical protein